MIRLRKSLIAIMVSISVSVSFCMSANATEIPQSLKEESSYITNDGCVEHECVWEDKISTDIMPFVGELEEASWIGISDSESYGRHRSAKEYIYREFPKWKAVAETELNNSSDNSLKRHYTRARIVNVPITAIVYADSDRCWGTGYSYAKTTQWMDTQIGVGLRSYWGYEE